MCPTLFHNIYKGALGEVCGKAILQDWGIEVKEITDGSKFERFDAITATGVYLDFKHWFDSGDLDDEDFIANSFRKLKNIGGNKAIIINVLKPEDDRKRSTGYTLDGKDYYNKKHNENYPGLTIITIPYLYDCNGDSAIMNMDSKNTITKAVNE